MAQIEIEKKFLPTEPQLVRLVNGATILGTKTIEDSYLDTDDFNLTLRDYWFRLRDGAYELKAPLQGETDSDVQTNRYRELTTIPEIQEELGLSLDADFETALASRGIKKFVTCRTVRNSYEKEGFEIDVDSVTYIGSDYAYDLVEIELLIEDEANADEAEAKIVAFALRHGLSIDQKIYGKVIAFLKARKPEHYDALVKANVA